MRIFVTGATGFIGSRVVPELIKAGHQVLGMTRSNTGADALAAAGATVHRGSLEEPSTLRRGAEQSDAVIHLAFDHDFSNFTENCAKETRAIEALSDGMSGRDQRLIVTSGVGLGIAHPGDLGDEDVFSVDHPNPRIVSEKPVATLLGKGKNIAVVRLPQVHSTARAGLITYAIAVARQKGVSAYVGDGSNRFAAAHVDDVARLYRLAVERDVPGARYNASAEEGVSMRDIATILGRGLNVPVRSLSKEEAAGHFGWLAMFADMDLPASSVKTQAALNWHPIGPDLLTDLEAHDYKAA